MVLISKNISKNIRKLSCHYSFGTLIGIPETIIIVSYNKSKHFCYDNLKGK